MSTCQVCGGDVLSYLVYVRACISRRRPEDGRILLAVEQALNGRVNFASTRRQFSRCLFERRSCATADKTAFPRLHHVTCRAALPSKPKMSVLSYSPLTPGPITLKTPLTAAEHVAFGFRNCGKSLRRFKKPLGDFQSGVNFSV